MKIEFTRDELIVLENAFESHSTNASPEVQAELEPLELKVGAALKRPWAMKRAAELSNAK